MATFGNTSSSGTGFQFASNSSICGGPFTTPAGGGTVKSFSIYVSQDGGGAGNIIFGVYSNVSSQPNTLLYGGTATAAVPSSAGWASSSGENYVLPTTATSIWLCAMSSNTNNEYFYTGAAANFYTNMTYPTWESPTYTVTGEGNGTVSLYATYTTTSKMRKILTPNGTRTGSRQVHKTWH